MSCFCVVCVVSDRYLERKNNQCFLPWNVEPQVVSAWRLQWKAQVAESPPFVRIDPLMGEPGWIPIWELAYQEESRGCPFSCCLPFLSCTHPSFRWCFRIVLVCFWVCCVARNLGNRYQVAASRRLLRSTCKGRWCVSRNVHRPS